MTSFNSSLKLCIFWNITEPPCTVMLGANMERAVILFVTFAAISQSASSHEVESRYLYDTIHEQPFMVHPDSQLMICARIAESLSSASQVFYPGISVLLVSPMSRFHCRSLKFELQARRSSSQEFLIGFPRGLRYLRVQWSRKRPRTSGSSWVLFQSP